MRYSRRQGGLHQNWDEESRLASDEGGTGEASRVSGMDGIAGMHWQVFITIVI